MLSLTGHLLQPCGSRSTLPPTMLQTRQPTLRRRPSLPDGGAGCSTHSGNAGAERHARDTGNNLIPVGVSVPPRGLEPRTNGLKVRCSTVELEGPTGRPSLGSIVRLPQRTREPARRSVRGELRVLVGERGRVPLCLQHPAAQVGQFVGVERGAQTSEDRLLLDLEVRLDVEQQRAASLGEAEACRVRGCASRRATRSAPRARPFGGRECVAVRLEDARGTPGTPLLARLASCGGELFDDAQEQSADLGWIVGALRVARQARRSVGGRVREAR